MDKNMIRTSRNLHSHAAAETGDPTGRAATPPFSPLSCATLQQEQDKHPHAPSTPSSKHPCSTGGCYGQGLQELPSPAEVCRPQGRENGPLTLQLTPPPSASHSSCMPQQLYALGVSCYAPLCGDLHFLETFCNADTIKNTTDTPRTPIITILGS